MVERMKKSEFFSKLPKCDEKLLNSFGVNFCNASDFCQKAKSDQHAGGDICLACLDVADACARDGRNYYEAFADTETYSTGNNGLLNDIVSCRNEIKHNQKVREVMLKIRKQSGY